MHIRDVMTPNPRTVTPDDTIQSAAQIMRDEDTGAVPVVDNGRPVGMLTDRDIVVRAVADGSQLSRPVREIVTSAVVTATPEMSTREAAQLMSEHQIRRLPVVEGDRLVGIVSLGDLAVKEGKDSRSATRCSRSRRASRNRARSAGIPTVEADLEAAYITSKYHAASSASTMRMTIATSGSR